MNEAPTVASTVPSNPILDSYRNSNPSYVDPNAGGPATSNGFVPLPVMDFNYQYGQPLPVNGGATYQVVNVPVPGQVQIVQASGQTASGFTAIVNGETKTWENLAAMCTFYTKDSTVDIYVSTASDSHLQAYVRAA